MAADTAVLSWNPNSEGDLAGYTIFYGVVPGQWLAQFTVGPGVTSTTLGLTQFNIPGGIDGTWYFAIDAFDTSNNHSAQTGVLSKRIIRIPSRLVRRK